MSDETDDLMEQAMLDHMVAQVAEEDSPDGPGLWMNNQGTLLEIKRMQTLHLLNCLRFCLHRPSKHQELVEEIKKRVKRDKI